MVCQVLSNREFKDFAESLAKSLGEPYYTKDKGVEIRELASYPRYGKTPCTCGEPNLKVIDCLSIY